jgi:hypothetical protein
VPRKSLSCVPACAQLLDFVAVSMLLATSARGDEVISTNQAPKVLGASTCASTGCHGGGGQNQNQFYVWSLRDFHSQRPFATLTTARSKQIADSLHIKDPANESRCTSCHAPLSEVPEVRRGEAFKVSEGVSCESCHGAAENWLRAHTRSDWTHADRTFAGMRDLRNLYVRANICVACHQTVETPLLKAGHPELIFELDGQSVAQPKHWREATSWSGAQTWMVGQAVALREMSWQLAREGTQDEKLVSRWRALLWLLQKLDGLIVEFPTLKELSAEPSPGNVSAALKASDNLAQRAAAVAWTDVISRQALKTLAATTEDFQKPGAGMQTHVRRAERLVLALDRLSGCCGKRSPTGAAEFQLDRLFNQVQSAPDFDNRQFGEALRQFFKSLDE